MEFKSPGTLTGVHDAPKFVETFTVFGDAAASIEQSADEAKAVMYGDIPFEAQEAPELVETKTWPDRTTIVVPSAEVVTNPQC
jgi:hypothetical protein